MARSDGFQTYNTVHSKTKGDTDIWMLPLEGDKRPEPFLITEFSEATPTFLLTVNPWPTHRMSPGNPRSTCGHFP
jgi:hypothetical protein